MIPLTRYEYSTSKRTVSDSRATRDPEKERRKGLVFKACKVDKIRLDDKKDGNTSYDP